MKQNFSLKACLAAFTMAVIMNVSVIGSAHAEASKYRTAILAGGCFWCVESDFDKVPGVTETVSGYIGGKIENPTYRQVTSGKTQHIEAVRIMYDPKKITYDKILFYFWRSIDPLDAGGQFCDRGHSYKTAIFAVNNEQLAAANKSKQELEASNILKKPIVTEIRKAGVFYEAEGYHQNFYMKNPIRYKSYRYGCRRDARVKELWGKDAHGGLKHSY